jgi:hypothetical protein
MVDDYGTSAFEGLTAYVVESSVPEPLTGITTGWVPDRHDWMDRV